MWVVMEAVGRRRETVMGYAAPCHELMPEPAGGQNEYEQIFEAPFSNEEDLWMCLQ
jgi:hypothetical protein